MTMAEHEMNRKLNSVGKTRFVQFFSMFKSYADGKRSKKECIEILAADGISDVNGAAWRCGSAKSIFDSKKECDALVVISESSRLPPEIVRKAKQLLNEYCRRAAKKG